MYATNDRPGYQAFAIVGFNELAAEPRYSKRDAIADAERMHQARDGKCRVVVLNLNHYSVGSLASCVYMLDAED